MKKFTLFVALFATLSLSAKNLPFKIAGIQATDANIESLVDSLKAKELNAHGKLSYKESTHTLVMDTFFVGSKNTPCLEVENDAYLTLNLTGDNYFSSEKSVAVHMKEGSQLTITGAGKLQIITDEAGKAGFLMDDLAKLNVMYTTLTVNPNRASAFVAEQGNAAAGVELIITNSQVKATYSHATNENGYAVENFAKLNIEFSDVEFKPNGNDEKLTALRVSEINEKMVKLDVENASEYVFSPEDKNYKHGLILARELNWARDWKDNKNLVAIAGYINDGTKPEYKWEDGPVQGSIILKNDTLFLKNASIGTAVGQPGITLFKEKAVTIHLEGENKITTYDNMAGIFSYHGVVFAGKGSLRVDARDAAIMMKKGMYAKEAEIAAFGGKYGICNASDEPYTGEWTLHVDKGADVYASGTRQALYLNTKNEREGLLLSNGTEIAEPYDPDQVYYANEVRFATPEWKADVEIAGRTINSFNCNHLHEVLHSIKAETKGEDPIISYNKEYGNLYFRNSNTAWQDAKNGPFLKIAEKLTIIVEGENMVEMTSADKFIETEHDITISGNQNEASGKLIAYGITWGQYADKNPYSGIYASLKGNANLTVYNVTAAANYFEHAIVGSKGGTHKVYFQGASMAMVTSKEATMEITDMSFHHCEITKPAGAAFSAELKGIAKDGKLVTGEQVIIRPTEEAIDNVEGGNGQCTKVLREGRLFIQLQDGTIYDATGRKQ